MDRERERDLSALNSDGSSIDSLLAPLPAPLMALPSPYLLGPAARRSFHFYSAPSRASARFLCQETLPECLLGHNERDLSGDLKIITRIDNSLLLSYYWPKLDLAGRLVSW